MNESAIIRAEAGTGIALAEAVALGKVMAESNLFEVRNYAQAVVKILAGAEMGFGPAASMADVHIIEGKPSIGAHLRAAAIKRSERYDYDLIRLDGQACELEFFELAGGAAGQPRKGKAGWKSVGRITVTLQEYVASGVAVGKNGQLKSNWQRHPDDMLFARTISKGYRRHCPDLSGGVLAYSPEELESQEIHDAEYTVTPPEINGAAPAVPALTPGSAAALPASPNTAPVAIRLRDEQRERIDSLVPRLGIPNDAFERQIHKDFGLLSPWQMTPEQADQVIARLEAKLAKQQASSANPWPLPAK